MNRRLTASRQQGFSLVELMVALTLSLILMAGALSILYSSRLSYADNDRIARLQEAGRTVVELMLRDARPAGYMGCSRPVFGDEFSNGLSGGTGLLTDFDRPAYGFDAVSSAWSPAMDAAIPSPTAGSDVLVLRTTRQGQPVFRLNAAVTNPAAAISVDTAGNSVPANTPMIISDCEGSAVFMATAFTAGPGNTASIDHVAGDNLTASLARGFDLGALVMPIQTVIYFVAPTGNPAGGPALWQKVGSAAPVELVEGVENLQVLYGVDTDGDLLINAYVTASAVTDWRQVMSLTVAALVRSPETGVELDTRTYSLLGQAALGPFNDRRQRSVFTTTVVLRNRTS